MPPDFAFDDLCYRRLTDTKRASKTDIAKRPFDIQLSNLAHLVLCQFRIVTPLTYHIDHVISLHAWKEMLPAYA